MSPLPAAVAGLIRDVPDWPSPGIQFKDITPLLRDPDGLHAVLEALAGLARDEDGAPLVDVVVGVEARGFMLAVPVAQLLGVGFVPVRKAGKLPAATEQTDYALEYGTATIEVHRDALGPGDRVLVVDDVLATGGTLAATLDLVRRSGAEATVVAVLMDLGLPEAVAALNGTRVETLLHP